MKWEGASDGATARHCTRCGDPLPARTRPKVTLCRLCAAKQAYSFLRDALQARRARKRARASG
jgi:hypothetical protein